MTRARNTVALWLACVLGAALGPACGPGGHGEPDGGDDGGGLSLGFEITPGVPGNLVDGVTVDSVELSIKDLRITGDAATGDGSTYAAYLAISWRQDHQPYPATFPEAPPGNYSKIAFKLENDTGDAFRIRGTTIFFDGKVHNYLIESDYGVDVSVPMNVMLPAGGSASDTLETHLLTILSSLDWSKMSLQSDGTLVLYDTTEMTALRERLVSAFSAKSVDTQ